MQLGQGEEAAAMFRGAIAVDPAHVKAMGNLAAVLLGTHRHAEAIMFLERALNTLSSDGQPSHGDGVDTSGKNRVLEIPHHDCVF